ncbi:MAG: flagellar export chaperone FliS [Deltaproteobacteria bacterium]|jgi:flagellar protein FliS|nr:flagellar export chaperone FliS [Deltaproteobacteria bacterium]
MQKAAHAYLQTNVSTTSPGELVILLYDGAVKFLNRAKKFIAERDYARKGIAISKAMDIINELSSTLNRDKGGELAENLYKLYFWCNTRLAMANLKLDAEIVDSVIKVLSGLRSAYAQIQNLPEAQAAAAQLAASQTPEGMTSRAIPTFQHGNALPGLAQNQASALRMRTAYNKIAESSL